MTYHYRAKAKDYAASSHQWRSLSLVDFTHQELQLCVVWIGSTELVRKRNLTYIRPFILSNFHVVVTLWPW